MIKTEKLHIFKDNYGTNLKKYLMRKFKEKYFVEVFSNKCNKINNILRKER